MTMEGKQTKTIHEAWRVWEGLSNFVDFSAKSGSARSGIVTMMSSYTAYTGSEYISLR